MLFDNSYIYFSNKNPKFLYNHEIFLSVNIMKFDLENKNFFLIKNKYNFLKIEFGFFNSAKEERINNKFLKTLIERSVDFLLIKKIDRLFFGSKKINKIFFYKRKTLTVLLESNNINIKKFYFKIFISKIKKLFYQLTNFELENLNYFTKKNLLNFCFNMNFKATIFLKNFLDFSFSIIFQKFYLNYIIFNYSKFFFFNINNYFFKNNQIFLKKIIVNYYNIKSSEKRDILLQLFDKNNIVLKSKFNNLNYTILYNFFDTYNIFDLKKNLNYHNFLIFLKKDQINFYFEKKINNFCTKIGFYDNLNFFLAINRFQKINIFFNFRCFYSSEIFSNILNKRSLNFKKIIILSKYNFDYNNVFQKKNLNKNSFIISKKNEKFINCIYFFKSKNIRFSYNLINIFDDVYKYDIYYVYDFVFDLKVQLINPFEKKFSLFYFLKKNKNLMLENLDIEKMNPKTYYKKFFFKQKCNELFFNISKLISRNNFENVSFQSLRFFFDIFFLMKFKIKILLKKKNLFLNKIELKNFVLKFFRNFINFTFLNTRMFLKEYNYLLKKILIFLFKNKGVNNYFFFNKSDFFKFYNKNIINKINSYNFKKYNLFIKSFAINNNFLLKLLDGWNNNSKLFLNQYFSKKLSLNNFHFNFIINLNYNFLLNSKYSKILNKLTKKVNFEKFTFTYLKQKFKVLKICFMKNFLQKFAFQIKNSILFSFKKNSVIFGLKCKFLNIFNVLFFINSNKRIQYYFSKINIVLLKYLNNILNHFKFQNNFSKIEKNYFENSNLFFENLFINFGNMFKINKLNFQNFEFLLSFSIFNSQNSNQRNIFNNIVLLKQNKIHYKFLKKIINVYLNFVSIKKNSFLKNFNFIFSNKYKLSSKIDKVFNLVFLKSNIYFKRHLLFLRHSLNFFFKLLYLKNFFYKKFLFFYTKIILSFFKFLQNKLLNNTLFNLNNIDLKIYSFFFFLTKKNQKKKNLLWLKINVTKRNVFVNLFVNKKKPSVFVFTAGQTFFEGRLKKTKEAGMVIGRKLWKHIVFLSKKKFTYNTFFFKNFSKIFDFLKINNQNFFNKFSNFNLQHYLKNSLISYKNILIKKLEKKKKIYNIFNKQKIIFFNMNIDTKYIVNKHKKQLFIYKNLKINNNNNLLYKKYNKIKLYLNFYNKIKTFYLQNFNFIIKQKYNFIFQFLNFNLLLNKLIKYKRINEKIFIRIWLRKKKFYKKKFYRKRFYKKKLFNKLKKFYKKKKFIKYKVLITKKKILIKNQKFTKKYIRKFQKFKRIESYIKKLYFFIKNNTKESIFLNNKIKYDNIIYFKKFNIFFKIKKNNKQTSKNFKFVKKNNVIFFTNLKLKKIILIKYYLINNFFLNIKKKNLLFY